MVLASNILSISIDGNLMGAFMYSRAIIICTTMMLSGCGVGVLKPKSAGEVASAYGYVPLDPLPVAHVDDPKTCTDGKVRLNLLSALPDLTIRYAVAELSQSGDVKYGASQVTAKNTSYKAVLDYANSDSIPVNFEIHKYVTKNNDGKYGDEPKEIDFSETVSPSHTVKYVATYLPEIDRSTVRGGKKYEKIFTFPVYVGIGLRLTADVRALSGNVNLNGLSAIGAQAELKKLSGTLTVQTLGVNGKPIAIALPLPNKLDQTTIETAVLSIGSVRAMIYSSDSKDGSISNEPRIIGLYSPVGTESALINAIYSELSKNRQYWYHRCGEPAK
jgi:hypothetical protein